MQKDNTMFLQIKVIIEEWNNLKTKILRQSVETYHQHYNYYYKWWLFVLQFFHNKTQSLQKIIHFTLLLKFVLDNITSIRSPILFRHNKLLLCTYEYKISLMNITKSSWLIQFFMAKTMAPWNYVVIVLHIVFRWKCSSNINNYLVDIVI